MSNVPDIPDLSKIPDVDGLPSLQSFPPRVRASILGIWFGDWAASGGEHYVRGHAASYEDIVSEASHSYSDDVVQTIISASLMTSRFEPASYLETFARLAEPFFRRNPVQWGPRFGRLYESRDERERLVDAASARSCGAPMRFAACGGFGRPMGEVELAMIATTHAHPESVAAAAAAYELVRHGWEGASRSDRLTAARTAAVHAERWAADALHSAGLPVPQYRSIADLLERVARQPDVELEPLDRADYISSWFVIGSVGRIAATVGDDHRAIIEIAYDIGGDPDTIAAISSCVAMASSRGAIAGPIIDDMHAFGGWPHD